MTRFFLALTVSLLAAMALPDCAMSQTGGTLQPTAEQKTIKDKDEYNAYMAALNLKDAAQRGAAMEAFAAKYPRSVVYGDSLSQAMSAYQAAGNSAKVEDAAARLVKHDPKNIQALAVLTYLKMNVPNVAAVNEAKTYAERGLKLVPGWRSPPGVPEAQFVTMKKQTEAIFYGAVGLAALYAKDYPAARAALLKTVAIHLNGFADYYRLAVAQLEMNPIDPQGFWYIAKAIDVAKKQNAPDAAKIEPYATAKYKKFHGSMDGWDALLAGADKENAPSRRFAVKPAGK
ncbi:MAG: hypothetical protein ACREFC_02740 [Stellaceae bacterium]